MSKNTSETKSLNPAVIDLVKLLARFAVEDYLDEIGHPSSRARKFAQAKKEITEPRGDE